MKNFIFILFLFTGCRSSIYLVVTDESFNTEQSKARLKKLILLRDESFKSNRKLAEILNKQNWYQLEVEQKHMDHETSDFLQAIRFMIESKYDLSYELLKGVPDDAFECEPQILRTDCLHDMRRGTVDSYYEQYQRAADCSHDAKIKELAKKRFLFVKHGY